MSASTSSIAADESNLAEGVATPTPTSATTRRLRAFLAETGDIAIFAARALGKLPDTRRFSSEILRQASIIVLSSGIVIWIMEFVLGTMCGTEGSYTLKEVGAPLYSGVFNAWCGFRECSVYMWGYIYAAKVGCGLVAELGSMRINDEVDALEVMGVSGMAYLVGTRVLATWLVMPFLFVVGIGLMDLSEYLVSVDQLDMVSSSGYLYIFWLYQSPIDFFYVMCKGIAMATAITFVCCYYGFTARGGPVGVGKATARSMMLNMILIHIIGVCGTELFWGLHANTPSAN
jgi:phospholipid/cholesterol/gamma-HCH transport system permease protein